MKVILDSTAIRQDFNLASPDSELLRDFVRKTKSGLAVSRIVIDEVVNQFREEISKTQQTISYRDRLLMVESTAQPMIDTEAETVRYRKRLEGLIIENFGGILLPYSDISHQDLIRRDLSRKKPFSESGRGYRDTLIWLSVLAYIENEPDEVAFITSNTRDFWSPDGKTLHSNLASEVRAAGVPDGRFQIFLNTQAFNSSVVKPKLQFLNETATRLQQAAFPDLDLAEILRDRHDEIHEHLASSKPRAFIRQNTGMSGYDVEDPQLENMEGPRELQVHEVLELKDKKLFISFSAVYEFAFQTWTNSEGVARWRRSGLLLELDPVEDHGIHQIFVGFEAGIGFTALFNRESKVIEKFQVSWPGD